MLESIKVTERLHWPQVEMSKHHVLPNSSSSPAGEKKKTTPPSSSSSASASPPTTPSSHQHHQPHPHQHHQQQHRVKVDRLSSSGPPTTSHRNRVKVDRLSSSSSSSVLRDLLSSNSYNVLLQAEDQRDRQRHRHTLISPHPGPQQQQQQKGAPCRRAKTSSTRCTSTFQKRNRSCATASRAAAVRAPEGNAGNIKSSSAVAGSFSSAPARSSAAARSISVLGSPMGLSPRPAPRPLRKPLGTAAGGPGSPRSTTRLPALPRSSPARDGGGLDGRKPCFLTAIKPSNVEKEKVRFFKSDFTYDPQFEYSQPVSPAVLARHSSASDRFLTQAVRIMELALKKYGDYETFEQATGGNLLTKSRVWHNVKKYMEKEGCVGEIVVHVTDDLLSRASMTVVNCRPTLTINISTAREHWLEGMLRHEIGTHYFRGINNSQQPWSSGAGRRRHGLRPLNPTEEGLASLHSVLFRRDPTLWRAALLYYTVYQAAHMSFSRLYHSLGRFVQDPGTRWDYCVRAKRGQTDTAQPGCFSKDQVYLDGILKILRHRDKINFPMLMALGKVSFEDVDRLKAVAHMDNVRIPHFLQDQAGYAKQLERIMEVNQLTDDELRLII